MLKEQYYIYLTTNLINGKKYIGQHYGPLEDSYLGSGKLLEKAISKYGKENFKKEILEIVKDKDELNDREKFWIEYYNAVEDDIFYNLATGGQGGYGNIKKYWEEHPEERQENIYNFIEKGQEALNEWRKNNPDKVEENIKNLVEYNKKRAQQDPEFYHKLALKGEESAKKWREQHPELVIENAKKGYEIGLKKWKEENKEKVVEMARNASKVNWKKVAQYDLDGNLIAIYNSYAEAERACGLARSSVGKVCCGEHKTAGGYKWKPVE